MEKKESMINPTIYIISVKIIVIFNNMDNTDTSIIVVITAFWSCCPASVTKPEEKPAIGGNTVKEGKGWDNIIRRRADIMIPSAGGSAVRGVSG